MDPSSISVLEEKHLRWLRHGFQKRLTSGKPSTEEDLIWASEWLEKLAALPDPSQDDIRNTKIHKVLRQIGNSVDIPENDTHGVKERANALAQRYTTALERATQEVDSYSNVAEASGNPSVQNTSETNETGELSEPPAGTSASEDANQSVLSDRYSSIQITDKAEDIERLFPLIIEFIDYPDRASTVLDFSYLHTAYDKPALYSEAGWGSLDHERNDGSHQTVFSQKMQTTLADIGFSQEEQKAWIRRLSWKDPEATMARESGPSSSSDHARDVEFARYAGALLLLLCPNITRLTYESTRGPIKDLLTRNNNRGLSHRYLQKLQEVTFLPMNHWIFNDSRFYSKMDLLSELIILHRLPQLQTVTMDGMTADWEGEYLNELPSATSSSKFSRLSLRHNDLPSDVVASLMKVSKRLEYLALTEGGLATDDGGFCLRNLKVLSDALCHHSSTLKILDLDINDHYIRDWKATCPPPLQTDSTRRSRRIQAQQGHQEVPLSLSIHPAMDQAVLHHTLCFREFPALEELSIGIEQLVCSNCMAGSRLVDTLPRSLQHLAIRGFVKGTNDFHDKEISHFLDQYPSQLPRLERVEGIDISIPNGKSVENPDLNTDLLWQRPEPEVEWVKVGETAGH